MVMATIDTPKSPRGLASPK